MTQPASIGLGYDLSCIFDLTNEMAEVGGRMCMVQALARRVITPRGGLPDVNKPPAPEVNNYGFDLTDYIDADLLPGEISQISNNVDNEFLKDERCLSSRTSLDFQSGKLILNASVADSAGPFRFVLTITNYQALIVIVGP